MPVFERAETFHSLELAATVIGLVSYGGLSRLYASCTAE
jgi:hypothetical protein